MAARRVRWRSGRLRGPEVRIDRRRLRRDQDLLGGEHLGPGGGQLDGQGEAVQPGGDLGDDRGVLLGQREPGVGGQGPLGEQPHRLDRAERRQAGGEPSGIGHMERRDRVLLLAPERQHDAGGDHRPQLGRGGEELLDHGAGLGHLLEVVDHLEELAVAEMVLDPVEDRAPGRLRDPQRVGHHGRDQRRVGHRGEVDEAGAVPELGEQLGGDPEGQPGLSRPTRPGQGEQAGLAEEPLHLGDLLLPAHERGELQRQVVRPGVQRPGSREVGGEALDDQLVEALGVVDAPQAVHAQVAEGGAGGEGVLDQPPGGVGHDHLPSVGGVGDPGRPVHVDADIVVPAQGPPRRCGPPSGPAPAGRGTSRARPGPAGRRPPPRRPPPGCGTRRRRRRRGC